VRPQMPAARPWAVAEWPRQRTTRMVRPIVPRAFSMAQNAHSVNRLAIAVLGGPATISADIACQDGEV
jgi:hypothetical protein